MHFSDLNQAVELVKRRSLPKTPDIEYSVLREIRNLKIQPKAHFESNWLDALRIPRFAVAYFATVAICSVAVTGLSSAAQQKTDDYSNSAALVLGFDTFQAKDLLALSTPSQW